MKKEDLISAVIMSVVSILVLIGFTVAWYTGIFHISTITGIELQAAEMENIKIALESKGEDISVLANEGIYADIGLQEMTNIETDKLAPGQFGEVTFYITPSNAGIEYCDIVPVVWIRQGEEEWYPGEVEEETEEGSDDENDQESDVDALAEAVITLEELYEITQRHIDFFADEDMTEKIDESIPLHIDWEEGSKKEKKVTIYWKWYYEYPFTDAELETLGDDEEAMQQLIDQYDAEDTKIGNNITAMKFHFTFTAK